MKPTVDRTSHSSREMDPSNVNGTATVGDSYGLKSRIPSVKQSKTVQQVKVPPLGLPNLKTGIAHFLDKLLVKEKWLLLLKSASLKIEMRRRFDFQET